MFANFLRKMVLIVPALGLGGCSWLPYAAKNTSTAFANVFHEYHFQSEIRKLADAAWKEFSCSAAGYGRGGEFEQGFKAGFTDYLDCNGNGQPPATPPAHLRSVILRSPKQTQDIEDWNAGFRFGADVASQARWRDRIIVPISLPPLRNEGGYREDIIPPPGISPRDTGLPGRATFESSAIEGDDSEVVHQE